MVTIDNQTVERLRDLYRNQTRPSQLLREILRLSPMGECHKLDLVANIRLAFALSLNEASPISGWAPDGSGELNDEKLDRFLSEAIDHHRSRWDSMTVN